MCHHDIWSAAQLRALTASGKWSKGDTWELTVTATSMTRDKKTRPFGFAGGGGFLRFDVPAGAKDQLITVRDTVCGGSKTRFEYLGQGSAGEVEFTNICLRKVASGFGAKAPRKCRRLVVPPPQTKAIVPVKRGATVLPVVSNVGFEIGQEVVIDKGTPIEEENKILGFGSLILEYPLQFDHGIDAIAAASNEDIDVEEDEETGLNLGATASLDAAGFLATTSLCCPAEMEQFFNRLLEQMGLNVCSKPHVQGLMHWFHCVPQMDFQYMLDVINDGNPCKYWAPKGQECPALSPQCAGHFCR